MINDCGGDLVGALAAQSSRKIPATTVAASGLATSPLQKNNRSVFRLAGTEKIQWRDSWSTQPHEFPAAATTAH